MTTCGYFWCWVIVILCIVSVTIAAVRGDKSGKPSQALRASSPRGGAKSAILTQPPNRGSSIEPAARAYRRGGARYVSCAASTRLDEGYIVGLGGRSGDDPEKMLSYAKKELAAVLAEQALAAGGIEFTVDGWELRAFMRTVTGREKDTSSGAGAPPAPQGEGKALGEAPRPQGEGRRAEEEP